MRVNSNRLALGSIEWQASSTALRPSSQSSSLRAKSSFATSVRPESSRTKSRFPTTAQLEEGIAPSSTAVQSSSSIPKYVAAIIAISGALLLAGILLCWLHRPRRRMEDTLHPIDIVFRAPLQKSKLETKLESTFWSDSQSSQLSQTTNDSSLLPNPSALLNHSKDQPSATLWSGISSSLSLRRSIPT